MNKEIEEIIGLMQEIINEEPAKFENFKKLLSYIEQLEADYKETNDSITWWTNRFNAVERDNRDYKSRIDKAIEYINKNIAIYHKQLPLIAIDYEEVINILKGDSDGI